MLGGSHDDHVGVERRLERATRREPIKQVGVEMKRDGAVELDRIHPIHPHPLISLPTGQSHPPLRLDDTSKKTQTN